jgi:hypothetical protein
MSAKLSFEDVQQLAKQQGRECLSNEYISVHTKLKGNVQVHIFGKQHPIV